MSVHTARNRTGWQARKEIPDVFPPEDTPMRNMTIAGLLVAALLPMAALAADGTTAKP